jgi:hypothetical protein
MAILCATPSELKQASPARIPLCQRRCESGVKQLLRKGG